jgi:uncharacterized secreted repeat protein (TIGR03808 family)
MDVTRRQALAGLSLAAVSSTAAWGQSLLDGMRGSLDAAQEGLVPGAEEDQSRRLAAALSKAEAENQALFLPPGRYLVAELDLPPHTHLIGVPGRTHLAFSGGGFMLRARGAPFLRMEGILLDGGAVPISGDSAALLAAEDVDELVIDDCAFAGSVASALYLRNCAGRVERSKVRDARYVGIALSQSRGMALLDNVVSACGDTGILVGRDEEGSDDTIVRGNRVTRIRADSGGTGQYGNGINIAQANGVVIADNRVDDCLFSAIRCFSSDNVQVSGNVATRSGEVAIYLEFAFEGAAVSANLVDGAGYGISFANFLEHGGRLATCSGNIVRNVTGRPAYSGSPPDSGAGISAEADVAITGNVVENALKGISLGWGPHLRDVSATANVIRRCPVGIAVSVVEEAGAALIANNLISGAERGAILGMRWNEVATGDLVEGSDEFAHLTIAGNRAG